MKKTGAGWPIARKAMIKATQAVEEDDKGNMERAVELYDYSAGLFLHSLKHETKCDKSREHIHNKCKQLQIWAEELRSCLHKEQLSPMKHTYKIIHETYPH